VRTIEVVFQRSFPTTGDHEDVTKSGGDGLFDDVLDRRFVDDRQHLLRRRLGRGKEAGTQPCGGYDRLPDAGIGSATPGVSALADCVGRGTVRHALAPNRPRLRPRAVAAGGPGWTTAGDRRLPPLRERGLAGTTVRCRPPGT